MKAFPLPTNDQIDEEFHGMDLRDYFAAKAMQGLLIARKVHTIQSLDEIVYDSYSIADNMMEARK